MSVGVMEDYKLRDLGSSHTLGCRFICNYSLVYLQLNKKKAKTEGKKCHAKTMWSQ
jgi:hypothetical protein